MGTEGAPTARDFNGQYDVSVLSDGRVRLPDEVVKQLERRGVKAVWLATLPNLKALVICPERFWPRWVQQARHQFKFLETEDGIRAISSMWKRRTWDSKGRLLVPGALMQYAGIRPGGRVVLVPFRNYFELWEDGNFKELVAKWKLEHPDGQERSEGK